MLKGSVFFLTALARDIRSRVKIDFLAISSFAQSAAARPGMVRIAKDLDDSIEDEDVLLVEDIVDTGFTTRYLLQTWPGAGRIRWRSARCSTALRAASCRCRWIFAVSKSRTGSWSASGWITSSSTGIWDISRC